MVSDECLKCDQFVERKWSMRAKISCASMYGKIRNNNDIDDSDNMIMMIMIIIMAMMMMMMVMMI